MPSPGAAIGAEVAGADGGKADAARPVHVHHAPAGKIALKRARRLLFDLRPRRIGNRSQLAMQVIHAVLSFEGTDAERTIVLPRA